jgi:DnaA-homolog protein
MKQIVLDIGLASIPSLDNFVDGPNHEATTHLRLLTATSQRASVPTYLWGESASGKTHLLRAVHQALRWQGESCGWMDADLAAPPDFNDAWSAVILDDCHLYSSTQQQAAFNWFVNALNAADGRPRWILAAGQLPPADLPLREDLRTRLGWGDVFGLQVPSEAQSRAVLRGEAETRGVFLSNEAMDFILSRFSRDLASLMQLLDQLDRYALQTKRAITIPLIKSMLESE